MVCAAASAAPRLHERVAVIDLGPDAGGAVRQQLADAAIAAGFDLVEGIDAALAGKDVATDEAPLAAAMAAAAKSFGALACSDAVTAAKQAIGIAAARQAAGLAVPELARAWAYVLLCADREGQLDGAHVAATQLRALGGSPDVPAAVLAKYPSIDAIAGRDQIAIDIEAGVPGAAIWVDFVQVGVSPVHVVVNAGEHVIAAASGTRRGWAAGTAIAAQKQVVIPMPDTSGAQGELARRIAGWTTVTPEELAWVLGRVHARVAVIRQRDHVAVWGQSGHAAPPQALAQPGAVREAASVLAAAAQRVQAWNAHAPDPDRALLTEDNTQAPLRARLVDDEDRNKPTKWWVYAAIAGAVAIGAGFVVLHDSASDRQRVELHYP